MIVHHEKRHELDQEQCTMKLQISYGLHVHNRGLDLIIRYSCFNMIDDEMATKGCFRLGESTSSTFNLRKFTDET